MPYRRRPWNLRYRPRNTWNLYRRRKKRNAPRVSKLSTRKRTKLIYACPIRRVLNTVHPELKISRKAITIVNKMMEDMLQRLANAAVDYRRMYYKYNRMNVEAVKYGTRAVLGNTKLMENACTEGDRALQNTKNFEEDLEKAAKKERESSLSATNV